MKIVFLGGTETVTGSKYLIETDTTRVLVDCGLFQGYKWLRRRNRQPLPLGIQDVDAILLTHAHLDHSGFIPVLYRNGFRGPVYTHPATLRYAAYSGPTRVKFKKKTPNTMPNIELAVTMPRKLYNTHNVEDSKAIASQIGPHIIIAGSGMATGGRILHHFKHWLGDHRSTVLFSGHQAGGTRGAKMQQGVSAIKVHGDWLPVKAQIRVLDGLSGHGDYKELHSWLMKSKLKPGTNIQLVHGEPDALEAQRDYLLQHTPFDVDIPAYMSILHLNKSTEAS